MEINEKETKETIAKINKTKSWLFEKINKLTNCQADSSRKKKRKLKLIKLETKKEKLQQKHRNAKDHKRLP